MATYSLNLLIDSRWEQPDPQVPMVCAYTWNFRYPNGDWEDRGQRPSIQDGIRIQPGDAVRFFILDLGAGAKPNFKVDTRPFEGNPFVEELKREEPDNWTDLKEDVVAGFNMRAPKAKWGVKEFRIKEITDIGEGIKFELTVNVTSGTKTFSVDPEMQVGPPGN
jgi:hypothetical protein